MSVMCPGARRNPATCGTNQDKWKDDVIHHRDVFPEGRGVEAARHQLDQFDGQFMVNQSINLLHHHHRISGVNREQLGCDGPNKPLFLAPRDGRQNVAHIVFRPP